MRQLLALAPALFLIFAACGTSEDSNGSNDNQSNTENVSSGRSGKGGSGSSGSTGKSNSGSSGSTGKTDSGIVKQTGDAQVSGASGKVTKDSGTSGKRDASQPTGSLAAKYADLFPFGVALTLSELTPYKDIIASQFNHLTAGNAMKASSIHPAADKWNTTEADALADFAREHGWKMTGHTLVWHRQQAAWMFKDLTAKDPASIETLKERLKAHIEYMVKRYNDVVDNWDVVNEAISDDSTKTYRDTGSDWFRIFGSEEYIYWAFKYTYDALEAEGAGNAKGKLYYNDYNETQKIDRILEMAAWLKEKGVTIDGIGFQAHHRMDWPSVDDMETALTKAVEAGYKVKLSELDITLYNDYPPPDYQFVAAPAVPFTAELEQEQAERYADILSMLRSHAKDVTSVTVWGFSDEQSWLNNEPEAGRRNYPLLFNDNHEPKAALSAIMDF